MSKSINQRSLRIGLVAITLVLVSSFVYAAAWNGSFEWLGFAKASAENTTQTVVEMTAPTVPLIIGTCDTAGPVEVEATAGTPGPTAYGTLKLAFDAINAGTHQGTINIEICASTTEGTTPATLNSSGAGSAVYTSILIRPLADGLSITGNPVTGFGVIQLNGADNVTIDGDNPNTTGTNRNLTVSNTAATTVIANSAIRIATSAAVTSADNDTIRNLVLLGNVTSGNAAAITGTGISSNVSFGIYIGGNGGATATAARRQRVRQRRLLPLRHKQHQLEQPSTIC